MTFTKERIIEDLKESTQNSSGMFEISEDTICALMSLLTVPPAPVSVPDEIQKMKDGRGFRYVKDGVHYSVNYANGWNQCRAAMLQGAEPVKTGLTLREGLAAIRNSGMAIDAGKIKAERDALNSPVIPDGWVACSERLPEGMVDVITSNGVDIGKGWWDGDNWKEWDKHDAVPGKITHWMPMPAGPQQEMKS